MEVRERDGGDAARLEDLIDGELNAKQRDRYRAALLAIQGEQTEEIQRMLRRSRGFVQDWAYAYRDGGIEALTGILMCGLSTGFFFAVFNRTFETRTQSVDPDA